MALKEISRSAVLAWCPVRENTRETTTMLALGSVGLEPSLEFCSFNMSSSDTSIDTVAKVKAESRFRCMAWGGGKPLENPPSGPCSLGVIAGGMEGGAIALWNPAAIFRSGGKENSMIGTVKAFGRMVTCLEFNPHRSNLLASGGDDGELRVIDINHTRDGAAAYKSPSDANGELTCLGWNRKVSHILATSSTCGVTVIWDLKLQKPATSFRDPAHRQRPSCLAWLPDQATQIVVAYDDERNPSLQLWDLRNANYPLRETAGHSKGILYASFNDMDSNLMLSCGKDNRTVCWTFSGGQPEMFSEVPTQQWHLQVKWSPFLPGIFAAASHTDKVAIYCMQQNRAPQQRYVPKWFKRPCGVHCGFGGKIVSFDGTGTTVKCHVVPTDKDLIARADMFEQLLNEGDFVGYCSSKVQASHDPHERLTWSLVKLLFEENGRAAMVRELGYDANKILAAVESYLGHKPGSGLLSQAESARPSNTSAAPSNLTEVDPEKFFKELGEKTEAEQLEKKSVDQVAQQQQYAPKAQQEDADWSTGPENLIKKSVLIGNLAGAVEVCLNHGRMADALLLASTGDPELWTRTRQQYIESQTDTFLKVVGCIVDNDLSKLVALSDLNSWEESLAILCTYSRPEEFKPLCEKLAYRLEQEKFDIRAAVICYLCAGNFPATVQIWGNMAAHHGSLEAGLQDIVEKMAVLKAATHFDGHDDLLAQKITKYAEILANSGRLTEAMRYLCLVRDDDTSMHSAFLRDRIYHSSPTNMRLAGVPCPPRPFAVVDVPVVESPSYLMQNNQQPAYSKPTQQQVGMPYTSSPFYPNAPIPGGRPPSMPTGSPPVAPHASTMPPPSPYSAPPQPGRSALNAGNTSAPVRPGPPHGSPAPNYPNTFNYPTKSPVTTTASSLPHSGPPTPSPVMPPHMAGSSSFYPPNSYMNSGPPSSPVPPTHLSQVTPPFPASNGPHTPVPPVGPQSLSMQPSGGAFPRRSSQSSIASLHPTVPPPVASPPGGGGMYSPIGSGSMVDSAVGVRPPAPQQSRALTAPTVAAAPVKPGMPVPWPIPTTSQQLGSTNLSTAEANQRVQAATSAPPQGTPMPPNELQYVMRILNQLLAVQTQQDAFSKRTEDLKKRVEELYDKLREGVISTNVGERVLQLCNAIERGDYITAQKVHVDLSASQWDPQNKNWLMGLKRLLPK